uniref:Uncharacterized protein n=1 Tax=Aegilops tauschii TaxID=37682 RepID=N1QRY7_AEGTA
MAMTIEVSIRMHFTIELFAHHISIPEQCIMVRVARQARRAEALSLVPPLRSHVMWPFRTCLALQLQDLLAAPDKDKIMLTMHLLAWAACLAGAAYVAVVCQLACVVSLLEDAMLFRALRKSRALLAGKFWEAAGVFVTLDGCIFAVLVAFPALVVDDALGLGLGFQLAAGAAMAVALCAVVLLTLVAEPVVYMVCKNHHHEVVDKVHLD